MSRLFLCPELISKISSSTLYMDKKKTVCFTEETHCTIIRIEEKINA